MTDITATVVGSGDSGGAQPDATSSFSFDGIHEKAMAFGENTPAAEAAPEQVPAEPALVADPTSVEDASAAQLAQLKDTDLVEIEVDGEKVQMAWKDARGGFQRQSHYTKSMQKLRADQEAFETNRAGLAQAQQERDQLAAFLNSKELVAKFIQTQYPDLLGAAQAGAQVDPDDIATVGQLQQNAQTLMANMQSAMQAELAKVTQTIEDRQAIAKLSEEINGTIGEIFSASPHLKEIIPDAEQMLRYQVIQLKPTTPEETLAAFKQVAAGWDENFKKALTAQNKTAVIAKQKLATNNIQPPGGAQVQPTPANFKTINKMSGKPEIDWKALNAAAMNYIK